MKLRRCLTKGDLRPLAVDAGSYLNAESLLKLAEAETGLALRINSNYGAPVILIKDHWRLLFQPVGMLAGSVRFHNCLYNAQIETVLDLCTKTEAEMLKVKNFGRKSLKETRETLAELNLGLGSFLCWWEAGQVERGLTGKEKRALREYIATAADEFNEQVAA